MTDSAIPLKLRVAVLIPCYNEEQAIAKVVGDFRRALPDAAVYVYDNNSRDQTMARAAAAGARVRRETLQGKGHVVRRMFADLEADVYVLVDGDDTYHAPSAPAMVARLVGEQLDMVVGCRVGEEAAAYRSGHRLGNALLTGFVARLFGNRFRDMLSGYRVFSRRFAKSFPALTQGFEIETELTVHALGLAMPTAEMDTPYGARPRGSVSKLSTFRDGFRILISIVKLFKDERPLIFFGFACEILAAASLIVVYPVVVTFLQTGLVPRLPTAMLATGLMLLAFLSLACGLILDTVTRGRREMKRLAYLAIPALGRS
ncbi:MAG TPA: glycosyltransferase family 2 protein [Candidatus Sulfotelmatobacter sp.]|nr:glycosyltransferase family 2 protein [Candidatus Sulfotelmatobacter sp.]